MSKEKGKERTVELAEEFIAMTDGKLAVVYDVSVDLHRNLTQEWLLFAFIAILYANQQTIAKRRLHYQRHAA